MLVHRNEPSRMHSVQSLNAVRVLVSNTVRALWIASTSGVWIMHNRKRIVCDVTQLLASGIAGGIRDRFRCAAGSAPRMLMTQAQDMAELVPKHTDLGHVGSSASCR